MKNKITDEQIDKEFLKLWDKLVPDSGDAETLNGNLIRAVGRLEYEYQNNGNCNACDVEYYQFLDADDDDTYRSNITSFYDELLTLISENIPSARPTIKSVREIILSNLYGKPEQFSKTNMKKYQSLKRRVVTFVKAH